jgi:phthalate 4,5-dioxygenase oxygenase subunit
MLTPDKNDILCRTGAQAPMGQLLRRYWLPVCLGSDLVAGGAPKRVRLLGEDLVAFRSPSGGVGLVQESCPHRCASLALARNEECGLRCLYHGWVMNAEGRVVETPAEPEGSRMKERVTFTAYPVRESGCFVFAYMGPADLQPPPLDFEFAGLPDSHVIVMRSREECNWAQCIEGVLDSAHSNYLHSDGIKPKGGLAITEDTDLKLAQFARPSNDGAPRLEIEPQPYGFRYAAVRKPLKDPDRNAYVRVTLFVAPIYAIFPAPKGWASMQMFMPIDDEHTMFYYVLWKPEAPIDDETRERYFEQHGMRVGVDMDENFRKVGNRENNWLQDRASMMSGRSFSGIYGINTEDFAVQESMGRIVNRSLEHLGASDLAVIHFRRTMIDAAERLAREGAPPVGLTKEVDHRSLTSAEGMVPLGEDWRRVFATPEQV